ncbi:hypothetical protein GCM10018952_19400 [Streptosporangium vulgare]
MSNVDQSPASSRPAASGPGLRFEVIGWRRGDTRRRAPLCNVARVAVARRADDSAGCAAAVSPGAPFAAAAPLRSRYVRTRLVPACDDPLAPGRAPLAPLPTGLSLVLSAPGPSAARQRPPDSAPAHP